MSNLKTVIEKLQLKDKMFDVNFYIKDAQEREILVGHDIYNKGKLLELEYDTFFDFDTEVERAMWLNGYNVLKIDIKPTGESKA